MWSEMGSFFILPLKNVGSKVIEFVPLLVGAVLILVVGALIAKLLRHFTEKVLVIGKLDSISEKTGISDFIYKIGLGRSISVIIGFLVYWLIFLVFILSAAEVLQFKVVSELLNQFILFIPRLISAVFVLAVGIILGNFLDGFVFRIASANNFESAEKLGKITRAIVIIYVCVIAIEQLQIGALILADTVRIVLISVAVAVGLAFGLGGKDVAAELLKDFFHKKDR